MNLNKTIDYVNADNTYIPCAIHLLPKNLWIPAAAAAIKINPMNAPASFQFLQAFPALKLSEEHLAVLTTKYWGSRGVTLTVGFLDNPPADLRARILSHMNAWSAHGSVAFVESNVNPQVRITRDGAGYWSKLGTDILLVPQNEATMNLQGFNMQTPDSEFYRVVRHETGHTLGFPHEHTRTEIVIRIEPELAYNYFAGYPNYWSREDTLLNVLTPLDDSILNVTLNADINSIMCYALPGFIMKDNIPVPGGSDIDLQDAEFTALIYPKEGVQKLALVSYALEVTRIAILLEDKRLFIKDADLADPWTNEYNGVTSYKMNGNRIGVLADQNLFVKEGNLGAFWVKEYNNVTSFQLEGKRIGVLSEGNLYVKEGDLNAFWVKEYVGITSYQLWGNRIAVLSGGNLYVKEGDLNAFWVEQYSGVNSYQLEGNRIAVLVGDILYVKEGELNAFWIDEYHGVSSFQLAGSRIAVLTINGDLYVKEGALDALWTLEYNGVLSFQLEGDRIGVLAKNDNLYVKEGALNEFWTDQFNGATSFKLEGNVIAVFADSSLFVKHYDLNAPWFIQY